MGLESNFKLLVFGRKFPVILDNVLEDDLWHCLISFVDIGKVKVVGQGALPYSAEDILNWAVLGKDVESPHVKHLPKGCDIYVGIKTPEKEFSGRKTDDKKFDRYQLGERGYELAQRLQIPSLLLDSYDSHEIVSFVISSCKK